MEDFDGSTYLGELCIKSTIMKSFDQEIARKVESCERNMLSILCRGDKRDKDLEVAASFRTLTRAEVAAAQNCLRRGLLLLR